MPYLIKSINDGRPQEEYPEPWRPGKPGEPVHEAQRVQQHVQRVRAPEPRVRALADHRVREHEDYAHYNE